ncbi:DNA polymerase III subunit delta [Thalassoglobus neptunius]|uniref:DNA polymerase III subunit delta n=1 Tax=Thalassoglobus neptunius TaxID=1938619 RepID=A0A5C5X314_9PLAN|nr:DNA polymerase III subunit delta [Thalassoglobus neptunius]TWT57009.1 DNA polymerase III subunit delta [Thalassoglobus neptunius]
MHATELAQNIDDIKSASLIVLFGGELHLKSESLGIICKDVLGSAPEDSLGLTRFSGKETDFRTIRDELQTVSMFSTSKVVLVEDADDFVSANRPALEKFSDKPPGKSKLILDVTKWPGNTKLAKKTAKTGLVVECAELTGGRLNSWLVGRAKSEYEKQLSRDAAQLMGELAGTGLGLLDQELQKLSSYVGDRKQIGVEDVRKLVGGWKAETTWTMINAIRDDQIDTALNCLAKLLYAGEAPQKILGGINFVFRKFAEATERSRQGATLSSALKEAGVFFRDIESAERYLRRIRRPRAERILQKLTETDYGLKGGSLLAAPLQMESLILWLTGCIDDPE